MLTSKTRAMNLLFIITYIIWISFEIVLGRIARSSQSDKKSADKHSEIFIWLSVIVSVASGVLIASNYSFPLSGSGWLQVSGLAVIFLGILFRFLCIRQLGKYFTVNVTIRKDHQLMQTGFYTYIRHPSYSGSLLSFLGFGLSLNSWLSLTIVVLLPLITILYRIKIEEAVLEEKFGQQYRDYATKTRRLIPFIY